VRLTAFGDAGLSMEMKNLGDMISRAVAEAGPEREEAPSVGGPVNLQKKSGNMKIYLSWESPQGTTGIAGWEVFRGFSAAGPFARVAQVNRSEYWDQAVERDRTYYYKVRSFGTRGGYSGFSSVVAAESAPTPNPPVILRTDSRVRGVQLTWLPSPAAADDPLKFKGYRLYRAANEDGPYREVRDVPVRESGAEADTAGAGKVIFVDTGIGDGERYFYRVTAYNEKGLESDFSRALAGSSLPRVGDVRAAGDRIREVPLSWKPVESPCVRGYYLYRSDKPQGTFARIQRIPAEERGADGRVSFVDREGVGDSQTWYYRVTAFEDAEIETTPSDTVSAVTRDKPPTPQGFRAEAGRVKRVPLTWQESSREDVRGYKIYRSAGPEGPFEPIARLDGRASIRMTDEGGTIPGASTLGLGMIGGSLQDGTAYFYRITSFNEKDVESTPSPVVEVKTKARPKVPADFRGETADGRILLSWRAGPESDIKEYHLYERGLFGLEEIAVVSGTSHSLEGLAKGKSRVFSVRAVDRDGLVSDPSPEITVTAK
jgi:fibronectin type 3 domain-containing protein